MKKLNLYILKEHAGPFLSSLSIIMFVFILKFISQYVGKIFGKGLSFSVIVEILYLNLAWMLALAGPMAALVATLMAFGRMAGDNEIVAIRAGGISFIKIIRPLLFVSLFLTFLMFLFNDKVLPEYNHRAKILFKDISRKKPTLELTEGVFTDFKNFSMLANRVIPANDEDLRNNLITAPELPPESIDRLEEITIIDHSKGKYQRTITARYGYLYFDESQARLVFTLYNGQVHELENKTLSEYRIMDFDKNIFYVTAEEFLLNREELDSRSDREMNIKMLKEKIRQKESKIKIEKNKIKAQLRSLLMPLRTELALLKNKTTVTVPHKTEIDSVIITGKTLIAARDKIKLRYQRKLNVVESSMRTINYYKKNISKYKVEIHKKLSIAFAIIVFVLVGAPLGIKTRKGSMGVSFVFSMGFFVIYWALLIAGEEVADRAILPPWLAMWLPNILIGALGIFLTWRTIKDTQPINFDAIIIKIKRYFHKSPITDTDKSS